ncbi:MAG: hypothetical protein ABJA86_06205 [Nocardioidaceae bacterium]
MASGVVVGGMVLGLALWLPVSHIHGHHYPHNALNPTHHSLQRQHQHQQQQHHRHRFGHIRRHPGPAGTYSLTPRDLAGLTHNSDAVFEAKIVGAHARMYRGSPQPHRLYRFKVLARIKGHVNPHRPIWQSTRTHSAQTRLEVGRTYLLATRNTPGNPYLVLRGPRAVIQVS